MMQAIKRRLEVLRGDRKGVALVITLLIITTLTGLTIAFSEDSGVEFNLAAHSLNGFRAAEVARSGISMAISALAADEDMDVDSLREPWANLQEEGYPVNLPEGSTLTLRVMDENSKINLNLLRGEGGTIDENGAKQVKRLFETLGLEGGHAEPLFDWLDQDDIELMNGAESYYYRGLRTPYSCANGPFLTIGQLLLVRGMGDITLPEDAWGRSIEDYFTLYTSDGAVNINTACLEVLQSLSDNMDTLTAQAIIDYRLDDDFASADDLEKASVDPGLIQEISSSVTVKSEAFLIDAVGEFQDSKARIQAVVVRNAEEIKTVYWRVM